MGRQDTGEITQLPLDKVDGSPRLLLHREAKDGCCPGTSAHNGTGNKIAMEEPRVTAQVAS